VWAVSAGVGKVTAVGNLAYVNAAIRERSGDPWVAVANK
jgi:hypothetical protein